MVKDDYLNALETVLCVGLQNPLCIRREAGDVQHVGVSRVPDARVHLLAVQGPVHELDVVLVSTKLFHLDPEPGLIYNCKIIK